MKHFVRAFTIILTLFASVTTMAAEKEYAIKAGFLYNFARYSQWQSLEDSVDNFNICSPDATFIEIADEVLSSQTIKGKPVTTQIIAPLPNEPTNQCHIVFITAETFSPPLSDFGHNAMLVGESDGFIESGGHIRFFLSGGKIRFEVSPDHLKHSAINISSKVLRLGKVVGR
ncbi:YfiR family protein [Shewanella maritima]|uniref:YfiR family protein n=1 Tax=Shewanella maritima TaxID=2520507 RepID=UPI0037368B15